MNSLGLNMCDTQSCLDFNCVVIYTIFPPNPNSQTFRIDNKNRLLQLCEQHSAALNCNDPKRAQVRKTKKNNTTINKIVPNKTKQNLIE